MSNQLQNKATALAEILAANKLTKTAEQKITHKSLLSQDDLGREMTREIHDNIDGTNADTAAADNPVLSEEAQDVPGVQDLNRDASAALGATGTTVNTMNTDGNQVKKAAFYRNQLAGIISDMNKRASVEQNFRTGTEVLRKFASLTPYSTQDDLANAHYELVKLATYNPVFNAFRDESIMNKLAADIADLSEAEGISPEEAAAELQAAADENPEMLEEVGDEATSEALTDLAGAEETLANFEAGVNQMAANATETLGVEVTPDDIIEAADVVQNLADEMGVPAEALIAEAAQEIADSAEAGDGITEEDMAQAEEILDAAAEQGISPEEVLQIAAADAGIEGDGECCGECGDGECGDGEEMPKEASCCGRKRRAGGRKVRKCASYSDRVAYVRSEMNRYGY